MLFLLITLKLIQILYVTLITLNSICMDNDNEHRSHISFISIQKQTMSNTNGNTQNNVRIR